MENRQAILQQLFDLYTSPQNGLIALGKLVGLQLHPPSHKVTVMLLGNHSSGKSSFINWYTGVTTLKTSVAIETQGFTLVMGGQKRETLAGDATLHVFPHLAPMAKFKGVLPYLSCEVVPTVGEGRQSSSRPSDLVTFIDTPGLADGELHYPYDIDATLLWLANKVDLIFVFFDPIGMALCRRSLNIIDKMAQAHSERMRFFLSKADEAGPQSDR